MKIFSYVINRFSYKMIFYTKHNNIQQTLKNKVLYHQIAVIMMQTADNLPYWFFVVSQKTSSLRVYEEKIKTIQIKLGY